jgi:hypothetical protein
LQTISADKPGPYAFSDIELWNKWELTAYRRMLAVSNGSKITSLTFASSNGVSVQ